MSQQALQRLLGGRFALASVAGTDVPLVCYFDEVLAPLVGPNLARPLLTMDAGRFRAITYEVRDFNGNVLDPSRLPIASPSAPEVTVGVRRIKDRLAAAIASTADPSVLAVLQSLELPSAIGFSEAYRIIPSQDKRTEIAIVDWGIRLESQTAFRFASPVPSTNLRKRLLILLAAALSLMALGTAFLLL